MKLNTRVTVGGKVATVCYNGLDGTGAVYGEHAFEMPVGGFGDELPEPDFMLKNVIWLPYRVPQGGDGDE